ncbi:MAG: hypothetical protein DHS20C02_18250 [Micavibrio sp.]|nr:MAG: hypothetical protein DHS20C02_18250 [Micavibrio sp.]
MGESAYKVVTLSDAKLIIKSVLTMAVRVKNVLSLSFICFLSCLVLTFPGTSHAEKKYPKLTEPLIRDFITKTAEITSGQNTNMSPKEIIDYLDRHLDKGARFKSSMQYIIPGQPIQKNSLSLNRNDFIESIEQAQEAVTDYETKIEIQSVKISKDGEKATVQTFSNESGTMNMALDDGATKSMPIEGNSTCNQILTLSKKGVIQMYSAQCNTIISFTSLQ